MQSVDAGGRMLTPKMFIDIFELSKKTAPPRFLTLRLHSRRYRELFTLADVPQTILVGYAPGPMGRQIAKVNCIKPPNAVGDGITIVQDDKVKPTQLLFEIHGIVELILDNLCDTPTESVERPS